MTPVLVLVVGVGALTEVALTRLASAEPTPIRASDSVAWKPSRVSIQPVYDTLIWENMDTASAHSVECVQSASSSACPWSGIKQLPRAQRDSAGHLVPTRVSVQFPDPGTYSFRCSVHPNMTGEVYVGAPPATSSFEVPTSTEVPSGTGASTSSETPPSPSIPSVISHPASAAEGGRRRAPLLASLAVLAVAGSLAAAAWFRRRPPPGQDADGQSGRPG